MYSTGRKLYAETHIYVDYTDPKLISLFKKKSNILSLNFFPFCIALSDLE